MTYPDERGMALFAFGRPEFLLFLQRKSNRLNPNGLDAIEFAAFSDSARSVRLIGLQVTMSDSLDR